MLDVVFRLADGLIVSLKMTFFWLLPHYCAELFELGWTKFQWFKKEMRKIDGWASSAFALWWMTAGGGVLGDVYGRSENLNSSLLRSGLNLCWQVIILTLRNSWFLSCAVHFSGGVNVCECVDVHYLEPICVRLYDEACHISFQSALTAHDAQLHAYAGEESQKLQEPIFLRASELSLYQQATHTHTHSHTPTAPHNCLPSLLFSHFFFGPEKLYQSSS